MPARVLDGAALSRRMREDLQPLVRAFTNRAGRPPGLALVLVGDDPASHVYVGSKRTHGTEVGFRVDLHQHPASMSLDAVLALVRSLNEDDAIDGILVQSPLPAAMGPEAARRVFETIDPVKDVEAKMKELTAGLDTWPEAVAARGEDPEDQIAVINLWRSRLAEAGVSFATKSGPPKAKAEDDELADDEEPTDDDTDEDA